MRLHVRRPNECIGGRAARARARTGESGATLPCFKCTCKNAMCCLLYFDLPERRCRA